MDNSSASKYKLTDQCLYVCIEEEEDGGESHISSLAVAAQLLALHLTATTSSDDRSSRHWRWLSTPDTAVDGKVHFFSLPGSA